VHAFVIDDALADPQSLIQFATRAKAAFRDAAPANFPGCELRMTDAFSAKFEDFFRLHIRKFFDARRALSFSTRLSKATHQAAQLHAAHSLPQCEPQSMIEGRSMICAELHLFRDETLGGTGFYLPRRPFRDVAALYRDSQLLAADEFAARYDIARGYCVQGNAYFALTQIIPAKFNRLVFYDGAMFRAPHIENPEKLTNDSATARLVLHGNFFCKRHANARANRRLG
jgi:Family of unknown function (DUF6445)